MTSRRWRWFCLVGFALVLGIGSTVLAAPFGSRSLFMGRVGTDVAELQRMLNSLGYAAGTADGIFGPRTQAALVAFQKQTGLAADGMADPWDYQALHRAAAYERATPYTVREGEDLSQIAAAHGTTSEGLIWLNQLADGLVKPGQLIRIPAPGAALPVPPATVPEPPTPTPADPGPTTPAPPDPREAEEVQRPGQRWVLPGLTADGDLVLEVPPPAPRPLVVGYYDEDWQGDPRALSSLRQAGDKVDRVVNFQFQIDAQGGLSSRHYPELLAQARELGIQVYGLVHNYDGTGFNREIARAVLSNPEIRRRAVEQMLQACKTFGLAGIDIDIENVPPDQRANYTALVQAAAQRLKPEGCGLTISVPAKTYDDTRSSWSGAFDYAALGQLADRVAIMTYDETTPGFLPGPVASLGWVERVAAFAASQIEPRKVLLGIAAYGYDWVAGTTQGRGLAASQAEALAARHGSPILWDDRAKVPYFTYWDHGTQRIVYFENAASTAPKLDLVAKYGLGGIAIWRLGLEDPAIWPLIQAKLR